MITRRRVRDVARMIGVMAATLMAAACDAKGGRTVITVYSPHGKTLLSHYEREFERENPDIDIKWVELGSNEILERLRAERVRPQVDVWFGAPSEIFARAASEGLLDTITPTWAGSVPADARDPAGYWYGTYLTPEVIAYNRKQVPDSEAPREWNDVTDAKWRDRVVIRDPMSSGTMRAIFASIMQQSIASTGKTDSGWALLRRLDANTKEYTATPDAMYEQLTRGDAWISLYNMPDIAGLALRPNSTVTYVVPNAGTPVLVDGIALVANSDNRTFGMRYIEFVTSREALTFAADSLLRIPVRTDIPESELPSWVAEARVGIKAIPLDAKLMSDSLDIWMKAWDSVVRGRNRVR